MINTNHCQYRACHTKPTYHRACTALRKSVSAVGRSKICLKLSNLPVAESTQHSYSITLASMINMHSILMFK